MIKIELPEWSQWQHLPQDAGQTVEVHYYTDGDYLYRRVYDRSDRTTSYARALIEGGEMDAPNGELPEIDGEWTPVQVSQ